MIEIFSKRRGPWYRGGRPELLASIDAASLEGADLTGRQLNGANLRSMSLNRARLTDASLEDADLWSAQLTSANLEGAQLRGADLSAAVLVTANLSGARLDQCNMWGANLAGAKLCGTSLAGADLTGARLAPANLTRANLSGAKLVNAYLWGARLEDAVLRGATLAGADLTGARMSRANLDHAMLADAHLNEVDLAAATLRDAVLIKATLQSALLEQADLHRCNLREADLFRANLRGAQLSEAELEGALLVEADLSEASGSQVQFHKADLRGARFERARLPHVQMEDVDARQIQATGAVFTEGKLCRANLSGAVLRGADLRNVNLWGADLTKTDLRGANLLGATVTSQQIADVVFDDATQWPAGIERPVRSAAAHTNGNQGNESPANAPPPSAAPRIRPYVFREHKASVVDVAMSPDGRLGLSADVSGEVLLWDRLELRAIQHLVLAAEARAVAFLDADGLAMIAGAGRPHGGDLRLWNIHSSSEVLRLPLPNRPVRSMLALSRQKTILFTQQAVEAWDVDERQAIWRCPVADAPLSDAMLSSDARHVFWATSQGLCVVDAETGLVTGWHANSVGRIVLAAVATDGCSAVTIGEDLVLRRWNAETGEETAQAPLLGTPRCVALDSAGQHVAVAFNDRRLRVYRLPEGNAVIDHELPSATSHCLRFSPDSALLLVAGEDRCVRLFDVPGDNGTP